MPDTTRWTANAPLALKRADGNVHAFGPGEPITGMAEDWTPGEHLTSGDYPKISPAPGSEPAAGKSKATKKTVSRAAAGDEEGSA